MRFEKYNIAPEIKRNLEGLNFRRPTDIQYKSIPPILKGEDVLAIAQTGTGKTAAFAIPVISLIHEEKVSKRVEGIRCLIMVPTRELAIQISEVFNTLCKHTRVKTFCIYGGVEQDAQKEQLEKGTDILVATPGRMYDLLNQKYINLRRADILILDEADHMLDLGFINDIRGVIGHLPQQHQTLFFSATINEKIKDLAYSLVENPIRIQISPKDPVSKNVTHSVAFIEMDDKRFFLERIIKENPDTKILVFVRTKIRAERVLKAMKRVGIESYTIHGDKGQSDRTNIMKQFKDGAVKVLIATDISARGIDVANVQFIINYDLPEQAENYVHRVGRTGRGTEKGKAISFCSEEEKPILKEIENFVTKKINVMEISKSDYSETIKYVEEEEKETDWKSLIEEDDALSKKKKRKKKK